MASDWIKTRYDDVYVNHNGEIKKTYNGKEVITKGTPAKNGYLRTSIGRRVRVNVHRLIAETLIPNPHNLRNVDHVNRVKTDNRLCNLRWFSQQDNMLNTDKVGNCVFDPKKNRWLCKVGHETIGRFMTEAEARACKLGFLIAKGILFYELGNQGG